MKRNWQVVTLLGILIDRDLSFDKQIIMQEIRAKMNPTNSISNSIADTLGFNVNETSHIQTAILISLNFRIKFLCRYVSVE